MGAMPTLNKPFPKEVARTTAPPCANERRSLLVNPPDGYRDGSKLPCVRLRSLVLTRGSMRSSISTSVTVGSAPTVAVFCVEEVRRHA
eukprot:2462254-Prymnesium_polylepis.1